AEIGKEIGVGTVVEGSVRRAANRIRVTVQVIDVTTQEHLWTAKYDDDLSDIFAVQSDIANKVATSLPGSLKISPALVPELPRPSETEAYLLYLQGQALMWKQEESSLRQSISFFEKAIKLDPTYARAYVGVARAYIGLGTEGFLPWMESILKGTAAAEKATALDPDSADAHALLAELSFMADDLAGRLDVEVRRALALNPNHAQAQLMLGALAGALGILEAYVHQSEIAHRLDPLSPQTIRSFGLATFCARRFEEAEAHWKKNAEMSPLDCYRGLADLYMFRGDYEQATGAVRELERLAPNSDYALLCRGYLSALRGDRDTALRCIEKLTASFSEGYTRQQLAGFIYFALGDLDRFFEYMTAAAKAHTLQAPRIRLSPMFEGARKDPRFVELISSIFRTVTVRR
ncbi:MAG: hypothetical protein WCA77_05445, partial [Thermoplasmata archaeon]